MKKFITPVAMKVTKEQYEKDLKGPLEKLGYIRGNSNNNLSVFRPWLITNFGGISNKLAPNQNSECNYIIENYNPELFLALAAMTEGEDWIVGEYVIQTERTIIPNKIFKVKYLKGCSWESGYASNIYNQYYRKATKEQLIKHFTKDHFVLPEKWCVKVTDDNRKEINNWKLQQKWKHCLFNHPEYKYVKYDGSGAVELGFHKEITFDEFKKYVLKNNNMKKENRFPFELTPTDARRIINIACSTWKNRLADKWAKNIVLKEDITITEAQYKKMREACDKSQNNLFDDIFGKDGEEVFYEYGQKFMIDGEKYLLCQSEENKCFLVAINISDVGNRYREPIKVNDSQKITQEELELMGKNPILIEE